MNISGTERDIGVGGETRKGGEKMYKYSTYV